MGAKARPTERQAVTRLLDKLVLLRGLDPGLQVHGASHHRYELAPPLAADAIVAFERRERVRLPGSYRAFLGLAGDGGAGPDYGLYSLAEARAGAGWVDGLKDLARVPKRDNGFRRHLLLSHHGCGWFTFMSLSGRGRGWIWGNLLEPEFVATDFVVWYEHWLDRSIAASEAREATRVSTVAELETRLAREGESAVLLQALGDAVNVPATRARALNCWRRAHQLSPEDFAIARSLAQQLGRGGDHQGVIIVCRAALPHMDTDRRRAELLHLLGLALAMCGRVDDALDALDQARVLAPKLYMGEARATARLYAGQFEQALNELKGAPTNAWTLNVQGLCHAGLGALDHAEACYVSAIAQRTPPAAIAAAAANLAALRA